MGYFEGLTDLTGEVLLSILPLVVVAALYHLFLHKIPRSMMAGVVWGTVFTTVGIILFLHGVQLAFLPAGEDIGRALASRPDRWLLIPLGFWLGLVAVLAEPGVRVLAHEVEEVSAGSVPGRILVGAIALGVAASVALALWRLLADIPLFYVLLAGYTLAFALAAWAPKSMAGMAFDSGAVATGPMIITFVLAVSVGAAEGLGAQGGAGSGFGLVALVALAPAVSILLMGIVFDRYPRGESQPQRAGEDQTEPSREDQPEPTGEDKPEPGGE